MSEQGITFVCASEASVQARCKGWRKALEKAQAHTATNPFTGEAMQMTSSDPHPAEPFAVDAVDLPTWEELPTLHAHMASPEDLRVIAARLLPPPLVGGAVRVGFVGPEPQTVEHREVFVLSKEFAKRLAACTVAEIEAIASVPDKAAPENVLELWKTLAPFAGSVANLHKPIYAYFEWG